ncbi:uncharacterized protein LOC106168784 [Lingula anatina]|uniref:Uncharacterized protein LOC106168784 n=1 Tax=Lingula anatina TaxID=7574 RepID=A0A1S3J0T9_LINAN|nr:uncharacterized protein LOC106168784 [Lingula anatina]|eukprot:XP_013403424.1 uncharacterized protein LOC106168784 [Lingula anatina]
MVKLCSLVFFVWIAVVSNGVLAGKLDWVKVVKRPACKRFDVSVSIDCDRGLIKRPSNYWFKKLCDYCREGIKKYWSRKISYGGSTWKVNVYTVLKSRGDRKKIKLRYYKRKGWFFSSTRSHNSDILKMTVKYLAYKSNAALRFKRTCAHEIGHSFLKAARGLKYSWGHKGTSSIFGKIKSNAPSYPSRGEIDLMKYYKGSASNYYSRSIAAESDVKDLVFKVRDSYTTNSGKC